MKLSVRAIVVEGHIEDRLVLAFEVCLCSAASSHLSDQKLAVMLLGDRF